jgi:hypothetical protein
MLDPSKTRAAFGVSALALTIWSTTVATATEDIPTHINECAAWTEQPIPPGKDQAEITIKYSEPIGDSLSVSFPDSARIQVIKASKGREPLTATLLLNTTLAVPGTWKVEVRGKTNACTGDVTVGNS